LGNTWKALGSDVSSERYDRVAERRRAVALARHFREEEGLSIAQIAERLDRSPSTVKAYLYDPSYANKGPYTSVARRAPRTAPLGAESRPGLSRRERTRPWRGGANQTSRPIRRSSARQGWWIGWERPSAAVA
jgi:hypothetical protein